MTSEPQLNNTDGQLDGEKASREVLLVQQQREEIFAGPLPHPEILAKYESVLNGSADRILRMAKEQTRHRREMEDKQLEADIKESRTGMVYALMVSLTIVLCGTAIMLFHTGVGSYISGSLLNLVGVASVINAFLRKGDNKENDSGKQERG